MIHKFLNREDELQLLHQEYEKPGFKFWLVYGRRRVGKTELIKKFISGKPSLYTLADKRGTKHNVSKIAKSMSKHFNEFEPKVDEFDQLFEYINKTNGDNKFIIIIDEFPYLVEKDNSIPSVFQLIVDEILNRSNIFLIITGSSISLMEDLMGYKSPLYGRRTGSLKLEAFRFDKMSLFFPNYDILELIKIYSVIGGTPYYCELMDVNLGLFDNISKNILRKTSVLFHEVEFLLKFEFRETTVYESILEAMSSGLTSTTKIANHAGINAKDVSVYLRILKDLRIIRKEVPITAKIRSRKSQYFINDNFFQFWFRFIKPVISDLEIGEIDKIIQSIRDKFEEYISKQVFEGVSKEFIQMKNVLGLLPFQITKLGRWWGGKEEIDLIGLSDNTKEIIFVECKWQENVNVKEVLYQLKQKVDFVNWNLKKRIEYYCIIAKSFSAKSMKDHSLVQSENILLFTLNDFKSLFI